MKKAFFLSAFTFFIFSRCFPSYIATHLPKLIKTSQEIVYGRIISVDQETFKIIALKKIKSLWREDTLVIQKFKNWSCAARYAAYQPGQEAIFFLTLDKNHQLQIMGAANEGELVVKADSAYLPDYAMQPDFKSAQYSFLSRYGKFICINLTTALQGIRLYLDNDELIDEELKAQQPGVIVYQHSTIEALPKNYFLEIVIDQQQRGLQ